MAHAWKDKYITIDKIQTKWMAALRAKSALEASRSVDFMNFAFYTRDVTEKAILRCQDSTRSDKMWKAFKVCERSGFGVFGVDDMEEAVKHLKKGRWTDESTRVYWYTSGQPKLYPGGHGFETAKGCYKFVFALEENLGKLQGIMAGLQTLNKDLQAAKKAQDWARIGKLLGDVKTGAEIAEPFLWSAPKVQSRVIHIKSYADLVGKIHAAATRAVKLQNLDLPQGVAIAGAVGLTVLDYVPILGGLYGAAVDWAIDFIPKWKQFIEDYTRRLDRASRGLPY